MTSDSDRFQQSVTQRFRVALAMPVSLFEVPSLYDSPRRVQRKPEAADVERAPKALRPPLNQPLAD